MLLVGISIDVVIIVEFIMLLKLLLKKMEVKLLRPNKLVIIDHLIKNIDQRCSFVDQDVKLLKS